MRTAWYNRTTTCPSALVALAIGSVWYLQVAGQALGQRWRPRLVEHAQLRGADHAVAALFLAVWAAAPVALGIGRPEKRRPPAPAETRD